MSRRKASEGNRRVGEGKKRGLIAETKHGNHPDWATGYARTHEMELIEFMAQP